MQKQTKGKSKVNRNFKPTSLHREEKGFAKSDAFSPDEYLSKVTKVTRGKRIKGYTPAF